MGRIGASSALVRAAFVATATIGLLAAATPPAGAATGDVLGVQDESQVLELPYDIVRAPDGTIVYGSSSGALGIVYQDPLDLRYDSLGGQATNPSHVGVGPDRNLWWTDYDEGTVGRYVLDTDRSDGFQPGTTTEHSVSGQLLNPYTIVAGPDGDLWVASRGNDRIVQVGVDGTFVDAHTDVNVEEPIDVVVGPDGGIWFTSYGSDRIGRIDPTSEVLTTYPIPDGPMTVTRPFRITVGPDGNLWFTGFESDTIWKVVPSTAAMTPYAPSGLDAPWGIVAGADGNLWFGSSGNDRWGRIVPSTGVATMYGPQPGIVSPADVTSAADGRLWFTGYADDGDQTLFQVQPGQRFSDVPFGSPFFGPIGDLANSRITSGYGDGTFRPSAQITRQAMVAFLYRLGNPFNDPPESPAPPFSDVFPDDPFWDEIKWAADLGIVGGYPDGTFRGANPVTRQAMAALLYRLADGMAPGVAEPTFTDVPLSHPFAPQIEWLTSTGVTTGYADGTFRPAAPVTRQAMAAFLVRFRDGVGVGIQLGES